MTQYTPGPWFVDPIEDDHYFTITDGLTTIGQVEMWDGDDDQEVMAEARANAALVAATPELLEALQQAVQALNTAPRFRVPHLSSDSYQIAGICDRALAKAKGGAK